MKSRALNLPLYSVGAQNLRTQSPKNRRAISPVISALILSAAVLVIGGSVWGFSQSAMTISAENYAESVTNSSETISERFIIEHVAYNAGNLKVWVFNYGTVGIEVRIEVGEDSYPSDPKEYISMNAGGFADMEFTGYTAVGGDTLVIRAFTRRENSVTYNYIVP